MNYNDKLSAEDQIDTEEAIASALFDGGSMPEEECQQLSQQILLLVLAKFRADLVED